jgi:hypothetical protein
LSWVFNDYCMPQGILVQYSVSYVNTQNGLVEFLIKRIKLIALLHNCNLPSTCWAHVVLHADDLIDLQPTVYHSISPLYLVHGNASSISHLWKFGCVVYALISPLKRTSMGSNQKMRIYVRYHSPVDYKVSRATYGGFVYSLVRWLYI